MKFNVFAYTSPGASYPSFISLNAEDDGRVMLRVRMPAKDDGSCGDGASVELPRSKIPDLIRGLQAVCGTHQR